MGKYKGRSKQNREPEATERGSAQALKGVIRKLKKENEQLRRELQKRANISEDYSDLLQKVEAAEPAMKGDCPVCRTGALTSTTLGKFIFTKCNSCKYQKVLK